MNAAAPAATPLICETPCETCAKEGLPLLLARYALMPADAQAPRVSGHLAPPELTQVSLGASAHYGLRLLRSGYVYVYDEARKRWDEYFVTADGFLTKLPERIRAFKVRHNIATHFRCARNGAAPLAGVITIRNPRHATKVWIGFSDVQWTDAVLNQHDDAAVRQRHMTCITVSGGRVEPQARTAPIEQVGQWLPEFQLGAQAGQQRFGPWCPHPFSSRHAAAQAFLQAVQQARPQGGAAIVALHDPVGLAMEIAALAEARKLIYMSRSDVEKPHFAASAIVNLEQQLKEQAKLSEIIAGEALAQDEERRMELPVGTMAAMMEPPGNPRAAALLRRHTVDGLNTVAQRAWRRYTHDHRDLPRFDPAAARDWLQQHHRAFEAYDKDHIAPLAQAHAAWMQHGLMQGAMACNYDAADIHSGLAYTAAVGLMMRYTSDKQPSFELYLRWLREGDASAASNLVMRALAFNQEELARAVNQADASGASDLRLYPTDAVASAFSSMLDKLPDSAKAHLGAVMDGLSGAALRYWKDFDEGRASGKAATAMAAASGQRFVRVPVAGRRDQFVQLIIEQLYAIDPSLKARPNQVGRAVAAQLRLLQVEGVPLEGSRRQGWYALIDRQAVQSAAAKGHSGNALAQQVAQALRSPAQLKAIDMARAQSALSRASLAAGVLGGVLMAFNYSKLVEDAFQGMRHERPEARTRLALATLAIAGFAIESLGQATAGTRLGNALGLGQSVVPEKLKLLGRRLGLGAGILMGVVDLMCAGSEFDRGDTSLGWMYIASGFLGITASIGLYLAVGVAGLPVVGWVILIGMLVALGILAFFIEDAKDNKLQAWLRRCHFGIGADKYPDARTQLEEYGVALGTAG
ncbi:T6SS effector BTH_I2691 family protein [Caldimonas caldifontis]|uniref:Toxin VasX N-terminal region domain-containing protein n=1 Tax=Caldimonas caldifontis TaxID=1452508 RepID=A0A2S5SX17_9BURK|nr:T6SS effector BTH_I2691 family protein [Caldimonas caldifontis]PPE67305.1 hypothetical protein C1704_03840 [Caldimonas caldifontis]